MFASQGQAKSFFVDRIAAEARAEGQPLLANEHWMMRFSESDPEFVIDPERVKQFEAEISDSDYEAKIASLLERAYERDTKSEPAAVAKYREASAILHQGDHYLLIMIDRAIGDRLRGLTRTTSRGPVGLVERSVEIALGGLLLLLLPVPVLGAVGAVGASVYAMIRGGITSDTWAGLLVFPFTGFLAWFCAVVGWRLVTRRRTPDGRLMPAWLLYVGASLGTMLAFRSTRYGPEYANREMQQVSESLRESLGRKRSKHR